MCIRDRSIAIFPPPTLLLANTPIVYSASFTRLGTWNVVVPAVVVPTTFQLPDATGYSVLMVYPVTAEPPSLAGAPHEAVISVLESDVSTKFCTTPGTLGVVIVDDTPIAELPTRFVACALNQCCPGVATVWSYVAVVIVEGPTWVYVISSVE